MSSSRDWYTAGNVEDLYYPDEVDWQLHYQAQEEVKDGLPIATCVRCEAEINPNKVFCNKCYDYLDERGYFDYEPQYGEGIDL